MLKHFAGLHRMIVHTYESNLLTITIMKNYLVVSVLGLGLGFSLKILVIVIVIT